MCNYSDCCSWLLQCTSGKTQKQKVQKAEENHTTQNKESVLLMEPQRLGRDARAFLLFWTRRRRLQTLSHLTLRRSFHVTILFVSPLVAAACDLFYAQAVASMGVGCVLGCSLMEQLLQLLLGVACCHCCCCCCCSCDCIFVGC